MSNYFSVLGLEVDFSVDLDVLERSYIALQKSLHPDCFTSTEDKELAIKRITEVNKAFMVLKSPLKRAEHILALNGSTLSEDENAVLVNEVFEMQYSEKMVKDEIRVCLQRMAGFFADNKLSDAARESRRLKYLTRLEEGGVVCNF